MNLNLSGMGATAEQLQQINALYQGELNRGADAGGLDYWASFIDHGYTLQDIAAGIANSPEYQQVHSAPPAPVPVPVVAPPVLQPTVAPVPVIMQPAYQPPVAVQPTYSATPAPAPVSAVAATAMGGANNQRVMLIGAAALLAIYFIRKSKKKAHG